LLDNNGRIIGINTAIARVASDGMPITSISFSLKSNVAKRWLREQGVSAQEALAPSDTSTLEKSAGPSAPLPSRQTTRAAKSSPAPTIASPSPSPQLAAQSVTPPRPYNLDRLISERNRAEADLEDMIREMRGKLGGR
jgi:serine protease Do